MILKRLKAFAALALALTILLSVPMNAIADAKNTKYVSEVYVAYGKDANAAKKALSDKGFTPLEDNLNDGGKTYAMLGYKTTDDIRESITDLAVMNMNGDYSVEEYKTLLRSQKTQIAEFLDEFMAVIREYRANLKAGKPAASYVHDLLNNYVEDDTGMKMGDLLNSETLQDKVGVAASVGAENPNKLPDLVTILLQGNAQVIKSMEVLLSMATDTADNNWLDRFASLDFDALLDKVEAERPELNTEAKRIQYLDNIYGETAGALGVEAVDMRGRLTDYAAAALHIDTATAEEIKKAFGDIDNDVDAAQKYQDWLVLGTIYEGLKNYEGGRFSKGEMLAFFTEEHDPDDTETFIPMAAALSDGQRAGIPFVSFTQLMTYAFVSEEGWKKYADMSASGFAGLDNISVYQNIDRDLYKEDGSVALTAAAQRKNNTADGTTGSQEDLELTLGCIAALGWVATASLGIITYASWSISNDFVALYEADPFTIYHNPVYDGSQYSKIVNDRVDYFSTVKFTDQGTTYTETTMLYPMEEDRAVSKLARLKSARFSVVLTRVFTVITLALAVASTVTTIISLLRDDRVEQLPIPKYLVDNRSNSDGGNYSINYKAVECNRGEYFGADYKIQKGSCADLMADEGKQWLVLYASKNSKAGKPLTPDLVLQTGSSAPNGYDGCVHLIGEKGAVNIAGDTYRKYSVFSTAWQSITGEKTMYIFGKLSKESKPYDESAGNLTATAFGRGTTAIICVCGAALGGIIGAVGAVLFIKKRKVNAE